MAKEDYYRYLMVCGNCKEVLLKTFNNIPAWEYIGIQNYTGVDRHTLICKNRGARVLFEEKTEVYFISTNVLPIDSSNMNIDVYNIGWDSSNTQSTDIKSDVLYELCLLVNHSSRKICEETYDSCICGIIPSPNDIDSFEMHTENESQPKANKGKLAEAMQYSSPHKEAQERKRREQAIIDQGRRS